jgi:hypothetical protein
MRIFVTGPESRIEVEPLGPTLEIQNKGDKGEKGDPGTSGSASLPPDHIQTSPELEWVIVHNLGRRPVIVCFDEYGNRIEGDEELVSINQSIVRMGSALSGSATIR